MAVPHEGQQWYGGPVHASRPARAGGAVWSGEVDGPSAAPGYPRLVIGRAGRRRDDGPMQLISSGFTPSRRPVTAIVSGTLVGATLVAGGLSLAYLAFGTPLLAVLLPNGRVGPGQMATGMIVMAIVLVAPPTFVAVGTSRLARMLASIRPTSRRPALLEQLALSLPPDVTGASDVALPDGRAIPGLLVGPFGAIVVREARESATVRMSGTGWQARTPAGWTTMENPVDRATRDAERVRHWLSHDDRDYLVKTYAVVIAPAGLPLARTPACAVLIVDQVPGFIASLPAQRSLSEARREAILREVRAAVARA